VELHMQDRNMLRMMVNQLNKNFLIQIVQLVNFYLILLDIILSEKKLSNEDYLGLDHVNTAVNRKDRAIYIRG